MKSMPRKRMRKLIIWSIIISLLIIGIVVFSYSPIGVTRLRIQNNIFEAKSITVTEGDARYKNVTQIIEAHNPFFWPITVTKVHFHSKGEYSTVWGKIFVDVPFIIQPGERKEVDVAYQFDEDRYLKMYAEGWIRERRDPVDAPVDPAASIKDFLLSDGFIFYSDDIPTGQAYCFTENYNPEYTDQTH
jgi:hypothetical protein